MRSGSSWVEESGPATAIGFCTSWVEGDSISRITLPAVVTTEAPMEGDMDATEAPMEGVTTEAPCREGVTEAPKETAAEPHTWLVGAES